MPEVVRTKAVTVRVKQDDEPRTVEAVFATLGVVDRDGDIIEPGAIGDQSVAMGAYNHDFQGLPPGYGDTYETSTEARFRGTFLDTPAGNAHYQTLKQMSDAGHDMDWSFRFFIEEGGFETRQDEESYIIRKARVAHVAPVEVGAGVNTRTLEIKSCGPECQAAKGSNSQDAPNAKAGEGRGDAQQKGSVLIDYSKLSDVLAPILASAVDSAVGRLVKNDGNCGCKDGTPQAKGETLGNLLRELRDEAEVTNEDLGNAAGISESTVSQIMDGSIFCPPRNRLEGFADLLNVPVSRLITAAEADGCDYSEPNDASAQTGEQLKGQGLGDLLRGLRDEKELTNDDLATAAGLSVASIGGILAGTTNCPKIGQLQGLARRLSVTLSSLVAAAEQDGCEEYGGSDSSADDQGQSKSDVAGGATAVADSEGASGNDGATDDTSDETLAKQIENLLSGFPGLPPETDPGLMAWNRYQGAVLIEQE